MPNDDSNPWDADEAPTAPGDGSAAADSTEEGAEAGESDAAPTRTFTPPDDTAVGDDEDDEVEDRRRIVIIAAVAFVLIAVIGFALTRGGDDDTEAGGGGNSGGGDTPAAVGGAVTITGTVDSFDRPDTDDGLGEFPRGGQWTVQSGSWAIRDNQAALIAGKEVDGQPRRNIAFVGTGYPNTNEPGGPVVQVRVAKMVKGAGLVFRYQGECDYWMVYSVPEFAIWHVERIVDCTRTGDTEGDKIFAKIKEAPIADGTLVGVVLDGDAIQIVMNGKVVGSYTDDTHAGSGRVGITVEGANATEVRFDDFVAGGPGGKQVLAPAGAGGGGSSTTAPAEDEAEPEPGE